MPTLQEDLRLLHDPEIEPGTGLTPWVWLATGVAVAGLILWWSRRHRLRPPAAMRAPSVPVPDPVAALDDAYQRARRPADYAAALTAMSLILRRARGREIGCDLAVLTTSELLASQGHDPAMAGLVAQFLAPADAVRFGGTPLAAAGFHGLYQHARAYLLGLAPRPAGGAGP